MARGKTRERAIVRLPPETAEVGKVEVPWQASVYVLVEDGGTVQVRHGVDDQRQDPIRLDRYQAAGLAYHLLRAAEGEKSWSIPRAEDLARLRAAFRQIREIGERELREEMARVGRAMYEKLRPEKENRGDREG